MGNMLIISERGDLALEYDAVFFAGADAVPVGRTLTLPVGKNVGSEATEMGGPCAYTATLLLDGYGRLPLSYSTGLRALCGILTSRRSGSSARLSRRSERRIPRVDRTGPCAGRPEATTTTLCMRTRILDKDKTSSERDCQETSQDGRETSDQPTTGSHERGMITVTRVWCGVPSCRCLKALGWAGITTMVTWAWKETGPCRDHYYYSWILQFSGTVQLWVTLDA